METLRKVASKVPLDMASKIVAFMQELKKYEQWVVSSNFDSGRDEIVQDSKYLVHKPYIDHTMPLQDIREFMWVLGLDPKLHAVYIDLLSIGDINRAEVPEGMVFRGALYYGASSIVLLHTHPSGQVMPSTNDIDLTQTIFWLGEKLRRPLEDHIILGEENEFYSFKDARQMETIHRSLQQEHIDKKEAPVLRKLTDELMKILDEKDVVLTTQEQEIAQLKKQLEGFKNNKS